MADDWTITGMKVRTNDETNAQANKRMKERKNRTSNAYLTNGKRFVLTELITLGCSKEVDTREPVVVGLIAHILSSVREVYQTMKD